MTSNSQNVSANIELLLGFTQFCIVFCYLLDACKTAIKSIST